MAAAAASTSSAASSSSPAAAAASKSGGIASAASPGVAAASTSGGAPASPAALDAAIFEIKEAIKATAARPGFNQMRSFLFNNNKDDEVVVVHDGANQEEYQRLKNSVIKIKMMVYRTSLQFKLPYSEVLKRAAEKHKEEKPKSNDLNMVAQPSPLLASPPLTQPLTVQLPQQPVAVATAGGGELARPPSLPVILAQSSPSNNNNNNNSSSSSSGSLDPLGRPTPVVLSPHHVSRPLPSSSAPTVVLTSPQIRGAPPPSSPSIGGGAVPVVLSPASASTAAASQGLSVVLTSASAPPQPLLVTNAVRNSRPPASVLQMSAQAISTPSIPPPPSIAALIKSASSPSATTSSGSSSLPPILLPTMPDATVTREVQASRVGQLRQPQQPQPLQMPQQQQQQQPQLSPAPPSPALPTTPLPPPAPSGSQQQPTPPQHVPTPEEQRILRYGKAILKLKHFRRNLKYAIWDYQDGKSIAEACQKNKITEQGLRYTLDLIISRTGETLDQFRDNKSSNCDELPGPRTEEYTANLRQAVFAFKQKRFGSLFEYASQNKVSLFDLVDELIKELEIENKLCRLKPVAPAQLGPQVSPQTASAHPPPPPPVPQAVASVTSPPPSKQPRQHHPPPPVALPRLQSPPAQPQLLQSPSPLVVFPTSPVALSPHQTTSVVSPAGAIVRRSSIPLSAAAGPSPSPSSSSGGVAAIPNVIVARNDATDDDEITALANESPAAAAAAASAAAAAASLFGSGFLASDSEEACSILSDIDEVIRDDTCSVNTSVSNDSGTATGGANGGASSASSSNGSNASSAAAGTSSSSSSIGSGGVITLSICGVCQRYFTDTQAFKEHEAAGCIDFEVN